MYLTILCIISAVVIVAVLPARAEPVPLATLRVDTDGEHGPSSQAAEVEAMIMSIVKNAPWNLAHRKPAYRKRIAAAAATETARHEIPIGLVPAIMFRESSFDYRKVDKVGAAGLMQVSPYMVRFLGCEMKTPAGQIDCGCRALVYYRGECNGDWRGAMSAYGSRYATCDPKPGGKLRWMVDDRFALAAKLRKIVDK